MSLQKLFLSTILLLAAAAASSQDYGLKTVVIDPGHGGHDSGGVSKDKKTYEKDLVLDIALMLGQKIENEYKDKVNVFYTRSEDVFIPLLDRANFANEKKADLFISIHINANFSKGPCGHSVHILGASSNPERDLVAGNLDVCKRENSVILLESDHSAKYQDFDPEDDGSYIFMTLIQSAYYEQSIYLASLVEQSLDNGPIKVSRGVEQNPFYVLWKTAMPSVLLELGFISNDADLAVLRTREGRQKLADCVFKAFKAYKTNFDECMKFASAR